MKFNITFMGPERIANLRRDMMLLLQASLEDLGHRAILSHVHIEPDMINLIIGAYFLTPEQLQQIATNGCTYYNVNTEIIKDDMLNFQPDKVDFMGSYLPYLRNGKGVIEMVIDNMSELDRYGLPHAFLQWAYHEVLEDINPYAEKDIDFYLFGRMTKRRAQMVNQLFTENYVGVCHNSCPYYVRNSYISRAKVHLNLIQHEVYTHVNCFRIGLLANNRCAILSEKENDPVGYLDHAEVCDEGNFIEKFSSLIENDRWKQFGEENYEKYKQITMTDKMAEMLDELFATNKGVSNVG